LDWHQEFNQFFGFLKSTPLFHPPDLCHLIIFDNPHRRSFPSNEGILQRQKSRPIEMPEPRSWRSSHPEGTSMRTQPVPRWERRKRTRWDRQWSVRWYWDPRGHNHGHRGV